MNQVPQPSDLELQFAAGAGYSEPGKESQFAAVYDNPIASPTTREHFGIDTNSNHVQATYDNPKNAMEVNGALPPGPTAATPGASGKLSLIVDLTLVPWASTR